MKSRELFTTPVLIVTKYKILPIPSGKFLHSFTPKNTNTIYQFIANQEPVLENGQRCNIGYTVDDGVNWVEISAISKAVQVDQYRSFEASRQHGEEIRELETRKSDERVRHGATDGHYLGKKYAWRIYGMAVARGTFDAYLENIKHPAVSCVTEGTPSVAYKDDGLHAAMKALIYSATRVGEGRFYSPLLPSQRWFQIKGLSSITDKK
jgi:hypothetical protein